MTETTSAPVKEPSAKVEATTKLYTKGRDLAAEDKLAPQAKLIFETVCAEGGDFTRAELITAITGKLETKQSPGNVLNFYMKKLLDSGLLKATVVAKSTLKAA
jgi:hypothetical protein